MNSYGQPDLPASAKVLSLVRVHHGLPSVAGEEIPVAAVKGKPRLERVWKCGARVNHLTARRRRIALEEIPAGCFPVILELSGGSNFVILQEKVATSTEEDDTYIVQFPDSRESLVRGDRLRELYDGNCVFLSPGSSSPHGDGGRKSGFWDRLRVRLGAVAWKEGVTTALFANLLSLTTALGMILAYRMTFDESAAPTFLLPTLAVAASALVIVGLLSFRREGGSDLLPNAIVDCLFIPLYALAAALLAGWAVLPFLWIASVVGVTLLASRCLGSIPSPLARLRPHVLALTFVLGAAASWSLSATGALSPALMAAGLVLGTCLVDRLFVGEVLLRELRMLAVQ